LYNCQHCAFKVEVTVQVCLIRQFCMGHSVDYPQCIAISHVVKCGKGVVTCFSASANHMHSARAFCILLSAFRNFAFYQNPPNLNPITFLKFLQWESVQDEGCKSTNCYCTYCPSYCTL